MNRDAFRRICALGFAAAFCLAIAAPLVLTGCGGEGNSPEGAVMKYINAWQAQNWNEFKAAVAPDKAKLTKDQEELAKEAWSQTKVKFSGIRTETAYDKADKNKATVYMVGGTTTYTADILGKSKTETQDISKMKKADRPSFATVKVGDTWYVNINLG